MKQTKTLIASISVATAAHFWFAVSEDITTLFMSRILAGFGAGNIGVIHAIIADNSERQDRARMMGLMGACRVCVRVTVHVTTEISRPQSIR